jgi:hypothetical protein
MIDDTSIIISSARLLNKDGKQGPMMCCGAIPMNRPGAHDLPNCGYRDYKRIPTACIAVRKNGIKGMTTVNTIRFDEGFKGSGYEDTTYMNYTNLLFPSMKMKLNNNCKLIHLNNMANQGGKNWEHNKKRYLELFPDDETIIGQTDWTRFCK